MYDVRMHVQYILKDQHTSISTYIRREVQYIRFSRGSVATSVETAAGL